MYPEYLYFISNGVCIFTMSPGIAYIFGVKYGMFLVPIPLHSFLLLYSMALNKTSKRSRTFFLFFLDKIMNIAMTPELHSCTATDLNTANMYKKKMKTYTFVCLTFHQATMFMNKLFIPLILLRLIYHHNLKNVVYLSLFIDSIP